MAAVSRLNTINSFEDIAIDMLSRFSFKLPIYVAIFRYARAESSVTLLPD